MEVLSEMNKVFKEVFDDDEIQINDNVTANDIDGWDSLSHVNLILAIEKRFGIKFDLKELLTFQNVGDLRKSIESKLKSE